MIRTMEKFEGINGFPRTAILISHTYEEPFAHLYKSMRDELWKNFQSSGIDVYYVIGRKPSFLNQIHVKASNYLRYKRAIWVIQRFLDQIILRKFNHKNPSAQICGQTIHIDIPEGLPYLAAKMNSAYFKMVQEDYEVIYRTTLSSVVNLNEFLHWAKIASEAQFFYGGSLLNFGKRTFVSGASLLLNQNAVKILQQNIKLWNHADLDDVAIGKMLQNKILPTEIFSINIGGLREIENLDWEKVSRAIQVRCKSLGAHRIDDEIMKEVLRKFPNIQKRLDK